MECSQGIHQTHTQANLCRLHLVPTKWTIRFSSGGIILLDAVLWFGQVTGVRGGTRTSEVLAGVWIASAEVRVVELIHVEVSRGELLGVCASGRRQLHER